MPDAVDLSQFSKPGDAARTADQFSSVMDKTFGSGKWTLTGGYRTPEREDQLRAQGAGTVPAGQMSDHSLGSMDAPGARDIVVAGMTPEQAAAKLKASGARFKHFIPEGTHGTQGAHLHIDTDLSPEPVDLGQFAKPAAAATPEQKPGYFSGLAGGVGKQIGDQIDAIKSLGARGQEQLKHPVLSALQSTVGLALAPKRIAQGQAAKAEKAVEDTTAAAKEHRLPNYLGEQTGRVGVDIAEGLLTEGALRGGGALMPSKAIKAMEASGALAPKPPGSPLLPTRDAAKAAARRVQSAAGLKKPESAAALRSRATEQEQVGAGKPTLMDVLPKKGQALLKRVGGESDAAADKLAAHQKAETESLSTRAAERTEQLTPHKEALSERIEGLEKERSTRARTNYAEPYAQPIDTSEPMMRMLNSKPGGQAIDHALSTAEKWELTEPNATQQINELKALKDYSAKKAKYEADLKAWESGGKGEFKNKPNAQAQSYLDDPNFAESKKAEIRKAHDWKDVPAPTPPELPTISGGTLDRVRIAMREKGRSMQSVPGQQPSAEHSGGVALEHASKELDKHLDEVEHLKEARADYRDYTRRIQELQFQGDVADMNPTEFKATLKDITPEQKAERAKKVVDDLVTDLGRSEGAVGGKESIFTTGRNARANLTELIGKEATDKYFRAVEIMQRNAEQAEKAASGAPKDDEFVKDAAKTGAFSAFLAAAGHVHWAAIEVGRFVARVVGRHNLEREGAQIAEWAVQQKDIEATLREIADAANPAKRPKSKLPKDVLDKIPPRAPGVAIGAAGVASALPTESDDQQP